METPFRLEIQFDNDDLDASTRLMDEILLNTELYR